MKTLLIISLIINVVLITFDIFCVIVSKKATSNNYDSLKITTNTEMDEDTPTQEEIDSLSDDAMNRVITKMKENIKEEVETQKKMFR